VNTPLAITDAVDEVAEVVIIWKCSVPLTAVWLGIFFVGLQQLEGHIVAPYIFGHTLRINPLLVIFALLLGGEAYGFLGALLALPIAAMVRETVVYLRRHLVLEPWAASGPLLGLSQPPPPRQKPPPRDADGDADDEPSEVASRR